MIKVTYEYSGKKFEISPYNTKQEKEILLLSMISEPTLNGALHICGVASDVINSLSENEKIAMLYKFRMISVGDDLNLKFKCKHCGTSSDNMVNISGLVEDSNITNPLIIDKFKKVTEDNFQEFVTCDVDDLELDEYEQLFEEAQKSVTKFNFIKPIVCQKCSKENSIAIGNPEFVIDNLSEDSIMSLYQTYNDLIYFGKYTKQDIDTLYPFERTILISLLNKTREDLNK